MPFTLAHPAAVLPLIAKRRKWLDVTALILGSMAPDFEYFIRFKPQAVVGHTFFGFFYFNLPLVLLGAYLWHFLMKEPLIVSLPLKMKRYATVLLCETWGLHSIKELLVFAYSAIIGMITHVFWDGFTHVNAYFVARIPLLHRTVHLPFFDVAVFQILQQASTLIGFAALLWFLHRSAKQGGPEPSDIKKGYKIAYWLGAILIAAAVLLIRICTLGQFEMRYYGVYIVSFLSGLLIGLFIVSFCFLRVKRYFSY